MNLRVNRVLPKVNLSTTIGTLRLTWLAVLYLEKLMVKIIFLSHKADVVVPTNPSRVFFFFFLTSNVIFHTNSLLC